MDEIDESFFGEEILDEENTKKKSSKKDSNKRSAKLEINKMAEKKEETKTKISKKEIKKEEIKIEPVKKAAKKVIAEAETVTTKVDPWGDDSEASNEGIFTKISTWKNLVGILTILLIVSIFTGGFNSITGDSGEMISISEAENKALEYVNSELLQAPFTAELESSEELGNLFKLTLSVAGQSIDSYVTKDGGLFFPQGFELKTTVVEAEAFDAGDAETISVDDDPSIGDENAPITIVEFSDFQCPFCNRGAEVINQIKDKYVESGVVRIVFRDFPLGFHPEAKPSAIAAECANDQGKFWEYHDLLFENQADLSADMYLTWAEDLELDMDTFKECLVDEENAAEVDADLAAGQEYGVSGTPAFFINGKLISGAQPFSVFEQEIEGILSVLGSEEESEEMAEEVVAEEESAEEVEESEEMAEEVVAEEESAEEVEESDEMVEESVATGNEVTLSMNAKKWMFTPRDLDVTNGDTVTLNIIPEGLDFTFVIEALDVEEEVSGKTSVTFVASESGSFEMTCGSCESWRGMTGTINVE